MCVLTALWASVRLGTPSRSRNPLGRKTTSCAACLFGPDSSRSGIAHCVRWAAQLYQQPSPSHHRYWTLTKLPEAFTVQPLSAGQVDWAFETLSPERLCLPMVFPPLSLDLAGETSTDCHRPTFLIHNWRDHPPEAMTGDGPVVLWSCAAVSVMLVCLAVCGVAPVQ